jgi:hypothetical protein
MAGGSLLGSDAIRLLYGPTFRRNCDEIRSVLQLQDTVNVVPSSPIIFSLIMEAIRSSETSVLTRATRSSMPEGAILHSHRREI